MNSEPRPFPGKANLRKDLRAARAAVDARQRAGWDERINRELLAWAEQSRPAVLAAFLAFDGEPDLRPALRQLDQSGVRLALPVVRTGPGRDVIVFRQWSAHSELAPNRYGIREPVGTLDIQLTEIDAVLMPLVGWDRRGGRLGMGASYYDRAFQAFAGSDRPRRIGVGYELQRLERVPVEPWDLRLHAMLTESGLIECRP